MASVAHDAPRTTGAAALVPGRALPWLGLAVLAAAGAGLFGRIMSFPLRHDEQMYLPVGALLREGSLYQDFGFNNLPNLAVLLNAVFGASGTDHYLLTGRLVIFAGWLLAAAATALIVRRATGSLAATGLAVFVLISHPVLLGPSGMLVTNNFLPVPFALLATHLFIAGVDRPVPHRWLLVAAGAALAVAAGFKANYVFLAPPFAIAALLLPRHLPLAQRLLQVTAPLALGGLVGAAPVLFYLLDNPQGFFAHTLRYHQGPHVAYWAANPDLDGPKVMGLGGKVQLAGNIWLDGATLLIVVTALALFLARRRGGGVRAAPLWPVLLVAALAAGAALVSFVPTPAFPQYYVAPIPFAIVLAALLYGRLEAAGRDRLRPMLLAVAALALAIGAPRSLAGIADAARPDRWTGNIVHHAGRVVARASGQPGGVLATLSPIYALEGGMKVYTELATGPLVYRVGELIPVADRRFYRMVSPRTVGRMLDAAPPAAVLVGFEGDLDAPLADWARRNGYAERPLPALRDRYGQGVLLVRPGSR